MEDLDMRPVGRKTINTPNLDLLKENFIKKAREILEAKDEDKKPYPLSFDDLKEVEKGEMNLDMQPINFADYKKTLKMMKLEGPNDVLMKEVIKTAASMLEGKKLEETIGKIEFVSQGKYSDIEKEKTAEEATDKHKARLVEISIDKFIEGHYVCGTSGAGFVMFDNCALHSLIDGVEKLTLESQWCSEPFSFKQYNLYLYRYQRHRERLLQALAAFIQETETLPLNPDAPAPEPEEEEEEEKKEEAEKGEGEKKEEPEKEEKKDDKKEEEKDDEKKEEDTEEKMEEELLAGAEEDEETKEDDDTLLEEKEEADTSTYATGDEATPIKRKAEDTEQAEEEKEEETPTPTAQRTTRRSKRQKTK